MSFSLTNNFALNARGVTYADGGGIAWAFNKNTNTITATVTPATPGGANPTAKVGTAVVNGTAATFMRSDAAPPIDQAIVPTWTGLHTFTGGVTISSGTFTLNGHTLSLTGNATVSGTNTGDQVIPVGANPSGLIGMSAVNGVATTFDRSDSRHAIDPAIAPTWSGQHVFSLGPQFSSAPFTLQGVTASTASGTPVTIATLSAVAISMFLVSAGVPSTGGPGTNQAVAIVRQTVGSLAVTQLTAAATFSITVSGANIQVTQTTGVAQVMNYNIIQIM